MIDCGNPKIVENQGLMSSTGNAYKDVAIIKCNLGFQWSDGSWVKLISCKENNGWTSFNATCNSISLDALIIIAYCF